MAESQTQHRASNRPQAPGALARTGFPKFGRLPQEIQNAIWKEALQTEAQKIVLHDSETGGIYLSQDLVSSVAEVNSAARAIAIEFYNVTLDVFACDLEYFTLSRPRRHQRGAVRLNLDYATLIVGFDIGNLLHHDHWWNIGLPEDSEGLQNKLHEAMTQEEVYEVFKEHFHICATMGRPCSEDVPGYVTAVHITSGLTESQRAQPPCCWNCELSRRGRFEHFTCSGYFPNAAFCRILVTASFMNRVSGVYTLDQLFEDCANLTTAQWWDSIKSSLMLCAKHENLDDENSDDEVFVVDIDNTDEDTDNAGELDAADQHVHNHDCTEKSNKDDVNRRENKEYEKFAAVCAREEKSFFF